MEISGLRITSRPTREKYKLNLEIPKSNQVPIEIRISNKKFVIPIIWNSLSNFNPLVHSIHEKVTHT